MRALIDGNSYCYAATELPKLSVGGQETHVIFGFIKTLRKVVGENPGYRPIVLWDHRAQFRYDIWPQYKGNRDANPDQVARKETVKAQTPYVSQMLMALGVSQLTVLGWEADDISGHLSQKLGSKGVSVLLSTGDRDWCQLVGPNVRWQDHREATRICNHKNFAEFTGVATPQQFIELKAMTGDTSDNIPPIGGFGEENAIKMLMEHGSLYKFLERADAGKIAGKLPKAWQGLIDNEAPKDSARYGKMIGRRDAFERNMKLVNLIHSDRPTPETHAIQSQYNEKQFKALCEELGFISILKTLDTWVGPFRGKA